MNKNDICKKIKIDIVNLSINEIEEIFKIIYKNNSTYTKNNNGIFINLNWLDEETLKNIDNYINFCIKSHNEINKYEAMCNVLNDSMNIKEKGEEDIIENLNVYTNKINLINSKQKNISSSMKFYLLKKKFLKQNILINTLSVDNKLLQETYLI